VPKFKTVPIADVLPPPAPLRIAMDNAKLEELAASIKEFGLIQPVCVTPSGEQFEIIDGHRRFTACGMLGIDKIAIAIFDNVDEAKFGMMLHANIMREDVSAAEEGQQFVELATKHEWGIDQMCRFFGRSEGYINERARLVTDFADVAEKVFSREINFSQAKAIMRMKDAGRRTYLLDQAVHAGANAHNLMTMVDDFKRQDRIAANVGTPATTAQVYYTPPIELPACIWCGRDDDSNNMTLIPVHSYHKRDLELLMEQVGNLPRVAAPQIETVEK